MVNDGSYSDIVQLKITILSVNPMRKQFCKLGRPFGGKVSYRFETSLRRAKIASSGFCRFQKKIATILKKSARTVRCKRVSLSGGSNRVNLSWGAFLDKVKRMVGLWSWAGKRATISFKTCFIGCKNVDCPSTAVKQGLHISFVRRATKPKVNRDVFFSLFACDTRKTRSIPRK